jgi:CubicO group peptidase (beta-lactamase class C family)
LRLSSGAAGADMGEATGCWSGVLDAGSQRLRLKLDIGADQSASIASLDQGNTPTEGGVKCWTADQVELEFPAIQASFTGKLVGSDRIDGVWQQGSIDLPLVMERGEAALAPLAPPRPLTHERLAELRAQSGSPALAAACARRNAPPRIWVDGERAVGSGIAVEPTDRWHLGSITKSMTALLVARLIDAGALRWDESVGEVLGAALPSMLDAYQGATLAHLLSHRSGLPCDLPMEEHAHFSPEIADARQERRLFARLALEMTPLGSMTETFAYSNNGYVVVGAMLEARLGSSWEDLMREHVFAPLGLFSAGFGAPGRAGAIDEPLGHALEPDGEALRTYLPGDGADNPAVIGPSGRVHVNLPDFLRYLAAHRDRTDYLQPDTWTTLHTPPFGGDYAMGWNVRADGALTHEGSNGAWYAAALVDGAAGIVAAAAGNYGHLPKMIPIVGRTLAEAAAAA